MALPQGAFIPTTYEWDIVFKKEVPTSDEITKIFTKLYLYLNRVQLVLNMKDTGTYDTNEFITNATFPANPAASSIGTTAVNRRDVFRKMVNFGALPNTALKSVAHGLTITAGYSFTRIYGTVSNQVGISFIPIPSPQITITVDATNINITTTADYSAYTITYIVLEYLKC